MNPADGDRIVIDPLVDGILTIDRAGVVVSLNTAAEEIFGYSAEEAVGQNVALLMPQQARNANDRYLVHYLPTGEARIIGVRRLVEGRRKDGSTFALELAISDATPPAPDLLTAVVKDVSAGAEPAELGDEAERANAVVETAVVGLIVSDDRGMVISMNPAAERLFGYTAREIVGRPLSTLVPFAEDVEAFLAQYGRDGVPSVTAVNREVEGLRKDGRRFPMDIAVSEALLRTRRIITSVVLDVSERKASEAAVRDAEKLESLGMLASGVAHDLNNLLVGVIGNAGLALLDLPADSPVRPIIQDIEEIGKRAGDVVRQLVAYSGKGRIAVEPIDVNEIVGGMTHLLSASISKRAVLRYDLASSVPLIVGDPTQLRQVVMNLIINASDAIGEFSGVIRVATGLMTATPEHLDDTYPVPAVAPGDYVFIEVSDTGPGISEETPAKIFEPFFTTKVAGRGLGLAVVLGVVRGHSGAIKLSSRPGRGTTFRVLFPRAYGVEAANATARAGDLGRRLSGLALVIDDDDMVRAIAARAIETLGLTVRTADDGDRGIELFREDPDAVRIVLLDLNMPRLGGEATFEAIRAMQPGIPVILMSGYAEPEISQRFAVGTGVAFIQKPYDISALRDRVREMLASGADLAEPATDA